MAESTEASPGLGRNPSQNYIVGAIYDSVFFIGAPLVALALGALVFFPPSQRP